MSKELEIKFSLSSAELTKFQSWLDKNAEFIREEKHEEIYFDNPDKPYKFKGQSGEVDSLYFLRVRHTEKGDSMCIKKFYEDPERPGYSTHCDEFEFESSDYNASVNFLRTLGYTDETVVAKTRRKYNYEDFEIVIDDVKNLGLFIEVELKADFDNPKTGHKKIKDFLRQAGITKINEMRRGYVAMLWNPGFDFGEEKLI